MLHTQRGCLNSRLANYQFLHLQTSVRNIPSIVLRYLCFVGSNQTEICLSFSINRRHMSVYKPDAITNSVLCEVDISKFGSCYVPHKESSCHLSKLQPILKNHKIRARHAVFLISTTKQIRQSVEFLPDKLACSHCTIIDCVVAQFRPRCILIYMFHVLIHNICVSTFYYMVI